MVELKTCSKPFSIIHPIENTNLVGSFVQVEISLYTTIGVATFSIGMANGFSFGGHNGEAVDPKTRFRYGESPVRSHKSYESCVLRHGILVIPWTYHIYIYVYIYTCMYI